MKIPYQFLLGNTRAQSALQADRAIRQEIVWPAFTSFEVMVRQFLMQFMRYDDLASITFACVTRLEVQETTDSHALRHNQIIRLTATGADAFRYESERINFLAKYVPSHRLGTGAFTLERITPEVAAILKDAMAPEVDTLCWTLATRAEKSFKTINTDMYFDQTLP